MHQPLVVRETKFLAAALAFHAAVLSLALVAPKPKPKAGAFEVLVPIEIGPNVVVPSRAKVEETPAPAPTQNEPTPQDPSRAPANAPRERVAEASNPPQEVAPNVEPTPSPTPAGTFDPNAPNAPQGRVITGLPGVDVPVWQIPGVIGPPPVGAPAPTTIAPPSNAGAEAGKYALADAMKAKDKQNGIDLPAAGKVASSLREAVKSSDIPLVARGTFEVRLGPNGNVVAIRAVSSSGGSADQWQRCAQEAAAALKAVVLALPSEYSKGAVITVSITSDNSMPSGGGVGFKGTGLTFDTADLGAHKQRVVKSSFSAAPIR